MKLNIETKYWNTKTSHEKKTLGKDRRTSQVSPNDPTNLSPKKTLELYSLINGLENLKPEKNKDDSQGLPLALKTSENIQNLMRS